MDAISLTEKLFTVSDKTLGDLESLSLTRKAGKCDITHHDDTARYHEQGQPDAGVQLFEEHITWNLWDAFKALLSSAWRGERYFEK